jgi:hypothetical protein
MQSNTGRDEEQGLTANTHGVLQLLLQCFSAFMISASSADAPD